MSSSWARRQRRQQARQIAKQIVSAKPQNPVALADAPFKTVDPKSKESRNGPRAF